MILDIYEFTRAYYISLSLHLDKKEVRYEMTALILHINGINGLVLHTHNFQKL